MHSSFYTSTHSTLQLNEVRCLSPKARLIHLADVDGEEVLDQLKGDAETGHIPVVVVSADASPDRPDAVLQRGAFAFTTKPIDIVRFGEILDRALDAGTPSRRG